MDALCLRHVSIYVIRINSAEPTIAAAETMTFLSKVNQLRKV